MSVQFKFFGGQHQQNQGTTDDGGNSETLSHCEMLLLYLHLKVEINNITRFVELDPSTTTIKDRKRVYNICDGSKDDCLAKGQAQYSLDNACHGIMYHPSFADQEKWN